MWSLLIRGGSWIIGNLAALGVGYAASDLFRSVDTDSGTGPGVPEGEQQPVGWYDRLKNKLASFLPSLPKWFFPVLLIALFTAIAYRLGLFNKRKNV